MHVLFLFRCLISVCLHIVILFAISCHVLLCLQLFLKLLETRCELVKHAMCFEMLVLFCIVHLLKTHVLELHDVLNVCFLGPRHGVKIWYK